MKNLKTKYIYSHFHGFVGYKTDGKNIEIVYTEHDHGQKILEVFNYKTRNTAGVQ
tara:strand:- start:93 stop:257 length:165 start_codon:yes stop_codon:yes gene_type:complete